ncbi:MAG: integral membrane sensor signal transduction histidine kinase [Clostridiales bacterium 38_11]|nr:MAG: integral membrane sensor signal transduction histidine kinase [Clostridiales bacterium 38_11]HBH12416.1 sensor histidine kinase [Clostridiales bacterium]
MTIRKQWLIALILTAALSVVVNSFVFSLLINRYFVNYTEEQYEDHFSQIITYAKTALKDDNFSIEQIESQLESHLSDPIIRIRLYDRNLVLLVDVDEPAEIIDNMMRNNMMNRMMNRMTNDFTNETETLDIIDNGVLLGKITITRYSSIGNSFGTRMFRAALITYSIISFGLVLIFIVLAGSKISKVLSTDLANTAEMAMGIDLGKGFERKTSRIEEIRIIQTSLEALNTRLKMKQKARKRFVDELIHQARTPLTILKNHLEAIDDGIIDMTRDEIKTCELQIDNLTSIISDLSNIVDVGKDEIILNIEEFEFHQLISQIIAGIKIQFDKKHIDLELLSVKKVYIKSDKYKLSQSIYNILTNAYKFTEPNGTVTVKYEAIHNQLIIDIEDSGAGIPKDEIVKIFDAYHSGESHKTTGEGLGLYIAKENVEALGGSINVESDFGKGSQFIITIPYTILDNNI